MRDTSQITNYDAIISDGEYRVETKLVVNGVTYYEEDLKSISTSSALFSDVPSVGNCYSGEIDVVMVVPNVVIPRMAEMKPYVRLVGTTLTSEWIPQGVFYIDTREQSGENSYLPLMSIHGFDAMLMAGEIYPEDDPANYPMIDTDVVDLIAAKMGVEVDERTYEIMTKGYEINLPATYTMREVLGNIASMYAANFCMSADGELRLVGLTDIGFETNYLIDEHANAIVFGADGTYTETKTGSALKIWADDGAVDNLSVNIVPTQEGTGSPSVDNIRPFVIHSNTKIIVAQTENWQGGNEYTIQYPVGAGTVLSGTLNPVSGTLVVDMAFVSLTGDESFTRTGNYFVTIVNDTPYGCIADDAVCSHLIDNPNITGSNDQIGFRVYNRSGSAFGYKPTLLIRFDRDQTATQFKNYLIEQYENGTPVQVCYKLTNPITYQLSEVDIETILGINYIKADTGDVTVTWTVDSEATHILV